MARVEFCAGFVRVRHGRTGAMALKNLRQQGLPLRQRSARVAASVSPVGASTWGLPAMEAEGIVVAHRRQKGASRRCLQGVLRAGKPLAGVIFQQNSSKFFLKSLFLKG